MLQCKTKWKRKKLDSICNYITTGKLDANAMVEGGEYRFYTCAENHYKIDTYAFEGQSLLISGNGANVGYIHYYNGKFNAYQRTYVLQNFDENIFYIKHYLKAYLKDRIAKEVNAGNIPFIKLNTLTDMNIQYPESKDEQQKIADILSTCDEVIEKTEETIEKYKQIKAGLMQDLFTRGLDENGTLRPTYTQAPDLYKYSKELDRHIPKEWDVKPMELVVKRIGDIDHYMPRSVEDGIPYIMTGDFIGNNDLDFKNAKKISITDHETLSKKIKPEFNDIIIARYATVGTIRIVKTNKPFLVSYSCAIIKTDRNLINPDYLAYYIKSDFCQNLMDLEINASTQKNIGIDTLKTISVFVPQYSKEQDDIVKTLNAIETKIEIEEQYLNKYKQIKQGLMKRLLTPPADAEIVEE